MVFGDRERREAHVGIDEGRRGLKAWGGGQRTEGKVWSVVAAVAVRGRDCRHLAASYIKQRRACVQTGDGVGGGH